MKKLAVLLAAALLAGALVPSATAAAPPKEQVEEGSILFPAVFAQGTFDGCWGGLTRRLTQTAAGQGSGLFGYRFAIDESTWNGKFVLEPTGGQGTVDLDIFLYSVMPGPEATLEDPPNGLINGGTPVSVEYTTREEGGETGLIPEGTTDAIVCMYGGPDYAGFESTFTYTGTAPVAKKKKKKK
jgi:hypothetical protein